MQSGGQFSDSDKAGSENTDSNEDQNDLRYGQEEDQTDDYDEAYYARWNDAQERARMVAALFSDDSDDEHMPDLVESDDESSDDNQPNHGSDVYAVQRIEEAVSELLLGRQEGTLILTDEDITIVPRHQMFPDFPPYANLLLAHPQCQLRANWSGLDPYSST